jgi:sugar lactone lactonase YvrE
MYYIDTPEKTVKVYEYKSINNQQYINFLFNIDLCHISGCPDGMTVDNFGYLWIAMWDGSKVICINPHDSSKGCIHEILLPVSRPTNCTFGGGSNLNLLYISTAKVDSEDLSGYVHVVDMEKNGLPNRGLISNLLEF